MELADRPAKQAWPVRSLSEACHGWLQMVVTRLQSVQRKSVRDLLVNVVATALHYNAELAVAALQQQGQLATILSTWFQVNINFGTSAFG